MKEVVFLNKNSDRWKEFEDVLAHGNITPDELADLYIGITDDLSYARTFYPDSETTYYLNRLAVKTHQTIYANKKEEKGKFGRFWARVFPQLVYDHKKYLLYSFLIFFFAMLIGFLSSANDETFVRLILGDSYVNLPIEKIEKGDTMAVYKKMNQADMFLGISFNNIRVAFMAFVFGVMFSVGTGMILFYNGVMLGAFQYFFYKYDLLGESILTIWIHGMPEIFSILVAGAAGIILGNSILFPGTYSRLVSFKKGVIKGIKIVLGLIPIFLVAAMLEGFVTRYTGMPNILRALIIISSMVFIAWYFFLLPYKQRIKEKHEKEIH